MINLKFSENIKNHCVKCGKPNKNNLKNYYNRGNYCKECNTYLDKKTSGRLKLKTKKL